jgi:hypothetical protein
MATNLAGLAFGVKPGMFSAALHREAWPNPVSCRGQIPLSYLIAEMEP